MKYEFREVQREVENHPGKTNFFASYMRALKPEIDLSVKAGYLQVDRQDKSPFKGWRGTVEHQIVVSLAAGILGEMIGLDDDHVEHLRQNGATHDAGQKFEKMNIHRNKREETIYDELYLALPDRNHDGIIGLDTKLQQATKPPFLETLEKGKPTLLQKVLFYADDIAKVSSITPLAERIEEARARDIKKNNHETNDWDKEYTLASRVEVQLFNLAKKNGVEIDTPEDLPTVILLQILGKIDSHSQLFR